jgi:hypothetical protein
MDRNRQRLAEPHRSPEHERHVEHDERIRHVASCRPIHDEATKTRHQKREERDIPPLPWRYPYPIGEQDHQDNSKIRRVEDVFTVHSQEELARDGDRGRRDRDRQRIGSQEEAKRQAGDQRAAYIERRQFPDARADVLSRQGGADHRARLRAADLEVEAEQAVYEQRREQRNLVVSGIRQQMSPLNRTMALRGRLVRAQARVPFALTLSDRRCTARNSPGATRLRRAGNRVSGGVSAEARGPTSSPHADFGACDTVSGLHESRASERVAPGEFFGRVSTHDLTKASYGLFSWTPPIQFRV